MPQSHKVLGQAAPLATTETTLYTVPASTEAIVSTLVVCNRGAAGTVNIAVRPAGVAVENKHYILYAAPLDAGESAFLTIGLTLTATDIVSVYGSHGDFSASLFGVEVS